MKKLYHLFLMTCLNLYLQKIDAQQPIGHDILLIINYNYVHYATIPFLKRLYQPYFPNMVFTGPQVQHDVELCIHDRGYYSYKGIAQIMQKYPNYKGYLWVHDDCVINPWNLQRFDTTKIWFNRPKIQQLTPSILTGWVWWSKSIGYQAIKSVYDQLKPKHKNMLVKNCGNNAIIAVVHSDIVYLPARFKQDVIELCALLDKEHSFLEIALPTLCGCLDDISNWELFNGTALWNNEKPTKMYSTKLDYLHPVKFSKNELQTFISDEFKKYRKRHKKKSVASRALLQDF